MQITTPELEAKGKKGSGDDKSDEKNSDDKSDN